MSVARNTHGNMMPKANAAKANPFAKKGLIPLDDLQQYRGSSGPQTDNPAKQSSMSRSSKDKFNTLPAKKAQVGPNPFDAIAKDSLARSKKDDAKWSKKPADADVADKWAPKQVNNKKLAGNVQKMLKSSGIEGDAEVDIKPKRRAKVVND